MEMSRSNRLDVPKVAEVIAAGWLLALVLAGTLFAADWPQWRGPLRSGVADAGTPCVSNWATTGPRKLWECDVPPSKDGGLASPIIAGGRVYAFFTPQTVEELATRQFTAAEIKSLGWIDLRLPDALAAKVEAARCGETLNKMDWEDRGAWMDAWIVANLTSEESNRYARAVRARFQVAKAGQALDVVYKLDSLTNRTFESQTALDNWLAAAGISNAAAKAVNAAAISSRKHAQDLLLCLDAASGKELWRRAWPGVSLAQGACSTPCVSGGRLYAVGSTGMVYCLDAATGSNVWERLLGLTHASFMVVDGMAIIPATELTALDAATGALLWRCREVKTMHNSTVLWRAGSNAFALCNTGKDVVCVDLRTGTARWRVPGGLYSTPAVANDTLVVLTGDAVNGLSAYRLTPDKAERVWKADLRDRGATPAVRGGRVYAYAKGVAACFNLADGKELWRTSTGGQEISSPVLAGDVLIVPAAGGLAFLDAAPGGSGAILAKVKIKMSACATPAVAGGLLVVRGDKALVAYELR